MDLSLNLQVWQSLTPGLAEVRFYAASLTFSLAGVWRAEDFFGIPALKISQGVLPSIPRPRRRERMGQDRLLDL